MLIDVSIIDIFQMNVCIILLTCITIINIPDNNYDN